MIKTLKNTIKEIYYWIKNKVVRFKKWLIVLIFGAVVVAAPLIIPDAPVEIPATSDSITVKIDKLKDKDFIENIRETDSVIVDGDFTKIYKANEKRLTIKSKNKLIDIQLLSSYHRMIGAGESVLIAEFKLKDWKKKDKIFDSLEFFNKKEYTKLDKQVVFKYCEEKIIQMELPTDFPEEAMDNEIFEKVVGDWDNAVEFTSLSELPHKNIRVGIFTETILGEKIEWLPTIDGFDIYEWAAYDVTELNDLEHDTVNGIYNSLVMIDTTHFILAYESTGDDGYIKVFTIDGSYNITQTSSLKHDEINSYNSLVKIDSTHFILAYTGSGGDGYIKTFSINGAYVITEIDSLEHDIVFGRDSSLVMIDATHFILAYMGLDLDGYIKTFSIDGNYDNITELNYLEHDTVLGYYNSLVKIDSTHFILAYTGSGEDGYIKTFSIDGSYAITELNYLEHDTVLGYYNSLVKIDSTHFILAYMGSGGDGYIKTFSIDGSYEITQIDSLEHDTDNGYYSSLVMIDSTHFILAYAGSGNDGYIKTFSIDGSYAITEINSLEHDIVNGTYNSFVMIDTTHFILAYAGSGDDGYIKTFSIEGGGEPAERRMFLTQ